MIKKELLNEIDEGKAQVWNKQYVKHDFHDGVKRYERIDMALEFLPKFDQIENIVNKEVFAFSYCIHYATCTGQK